MKSEDFLLSRNETLQSIRSRRSIRSFSDEKVSEEDINTVLQAANQAPSAHNQQSWKFIILKGVKKDGLVELIYSKAGNFPRPSSALLRMACRSIAGAPVVIAVANTGELIRHGGGLFEAENEVAVDFFRTMEIQSSAAAVQNIILAATSLELATVWLGILFLIKDDVLRFLGEPGGEFMAVIPLGHPARTSQGPTKRPLEMTVKYME